MTVIALKRAWSFRGQRPNTNTSFYLLFRCLSSVAPLTTDPTVALPLLCGSAHNGRSGADQRLSEPTHVALLSRGPTVDLTKFVAPPSDCCSICSDYLLWLHQIMNIVVIVFFIPYTFSAFELLQEP